MAERTRIPRAEAEALASEVVKSFSPFCERIEVLGSIRRRKADVGDVEIGLIPRFDMLLDPGDMFAEAMVRTNLQLAEVKRLLALGGDWAHRLDKNDAKCCGEGVQRLTCKGFALDVFATVDPDAWGVLKLIRTGSGDFNKRVVLQKAQGGTVLPMGMQFAGGRLIDRMRPVPTPTEESVFEAIGMTYVRPEDRHA